MLHFWRALGTLSYLKSLASSLSFRLSSTVSSIINKWFFSNTIYVSLNTVPRHLHTLSGNSWTKFPTSMLHWSFHQRVICSILLATRWGAAVSWLTILIQSILNMWSLSELSKVATWDCWSSASVGHIYGHCSGMLYRLIPAFHYWHNLLEQSLVLGVDISLAI